MTTCLPIDSKERNGVFRNRSPSLFFHVLFDLEVHTHCLWILFACRNCKFSSSWDTKQCESFHEQWWELWIPQKPTSSFWPVLLFFDRPLSSVPSSLSRVSWCRDASNCSLAYPLWRLRMKRCVSFLAAQSHCLHVELLVAVHQGQVEGACRECPGYCKDFLATWKVGLSPLLHPALEIQEVVHTLPKVVLYFELLQNASLHYTFNQSVGHCMNNIKFLKWPPHDWLSPAFQKETIDFDTSDISNVLKEGDFFFLNTAYFLLISSLRQFGQ